VTRIVTNVLTTSCLLFYNQSLMYVQLKMCLLIGTLCVVKDCSQYRTTGDAVVLLTSSSFIIIAMNNEDLCYLVRRGEVGSVRKLPVCNLWTGKEPVISLSTINSYI
jgi:hypothetical protein